MKKKNIAPLNFVSGGLFLTAGILEFISGNSTMGIVFVSLGLSHYCLGLMNARRNNKSEEKETDNI